MQPPTSNIELPDRPALEAMFVAKYGQPKSAGWAPKRRFQAGYYPPSEIYEAIVDRLVEPGEQWLDVGGGRYVFPGHDRLAERIAQRSGSLISVDPSDNVHDNPFAHETYQSMLEDYPGDRVFDLATMRMVVEHVADPAGFTAALARLLKPGGRAVVLTVDRWAPLSLLASVVPFGWHYPLKRLLWGGEERDTFPVHYRMNTLASLRRRFAEAGFEAELEAKLDDLSTFGAIAPLNRVELTTLRALRSMGLGYPERCLLGVYRKL